jgi:hypothetical protein
VRWGFQRTITQERLFDAFVECVVVVLSLQDATQSTHHVWCGLQDDRTLRKKGYLVHFLVRWGFQRTITQEKLIDAFVGCVGFVNAPLRKKG